MTALLTTRQLASVLAVSPETVLRWWRRGELPGYRLGSNVLRFDPNEVHDWLERRRHATVAGVTASAGPVQPQPSILDPSREPRVNAPTRPFSASPRGKEKR